MNSVATSAYVRSVCWRPARALRSRGVARPGDLLAPLANGEELLGLTDARVISVTRDAEGALLRTPSVAQAVIDALIASLRDRKASLANFARFPHVERVRGKLLQLARSHAGAGRAGRMRMRRARRPPLPRARRARGA